MESRSSGESRRINVNYARSGESNGKSYGESRTIASNSPQNPTIHSEEIVALRKRLEELKTELLIAEEESKLREEVAKMEAKIISVKMPK